MYRMMWREISARPTRAESALDDEAGNIWQACLVEGQAARLRRALRPLTRRLRVGVQVEILKANDLSGLSYISFKI